MNRETTPEQGLVQAMRRVLDGRVTGGDASEWSEALSRELADAGFKVSVDYHYTRHDGHPGNCYHCGRPENPHPFVVSGTPLELRSSEGEAGRFRHWGGDDLWSCQAHPTYTGEAGTSPDLDRTMDFHQAIEHLAARDGLPQALNLTLGEVMKQEAAYQATNADRLTALDAAAPNGGHQGESARRTKADEA